MSLPTKVGRHHATGAEGLFAPRARRIWVPAVIGALTLLLLGHGSYSAAYQPEELPNTPQHLAVGTTFGLLLSNDDGGSWTWICDEAIQYGQGLNPAWHFSQTGAIFAGSFRGLWGIYAPGPATGQGRQRNDPNNLNRHWGPNIVENVRDLERAVGLAPPT